jgi:hypothetical protein
MKEMTMPTFLIPGAAREPISPRKIGKKREAENLDNSESLEVQHQAEIDRIMAMPEEKKASFSEGMANLGYRIEEKKNRCWETLVRKINGENQDGSIRTDSMMRRYLNEYAEKFSEDAEKAKAEAETQGKGFWKKITGVGKGTGNLFRYGRAAADVFISSAVNPFRYVTMTAMVASTSAEVAKRTRLKNETVREKSRVQDEATAADEAWSLYQEAEAEQGKGGVDSKTLTNKFKEKLPKDLLARLEKAEQPGLSLLSKVLAKDLIWAVDRLEGKLEQISQDENLSAAEKSRKKKSIISRNEQFLDDLNRMVGDQGIVDTLAYTARLTEKGAKATANLLMIDSLVRLFKAIPELVHRAQDLDLAQTGQEVSRIAGKVAKAAFSPSSAEAADYIPQGEPDTGGQDAAARYMPKTTTFSVLEEKLKLTPDGQSPADTKIPPGPGASTPETVAAAGGAKQFVRPVGAAEPVPAEKFPEAPDNYGKAQLKEMGALVGKGKGIEHVFKNQLVKDPESFGYEGGVDDHAAINKWAGNRAHELAIEKGYVDTESGLEVRVKGANQAAYVLESNKGGDIRVAEYHQGEGDSFELTETHDDGQIEFEGKGRNDYEYLDKPTPKAAEVVDQPVTGKTTETATPANKAAAGGTENAADNFKSLREQFAQAYGAENLDKKFFEIVNTPAKIEFVKGHAGLFDLAKADEINNYFTLGDKLGLPYEDHSLVSTFQRMPVSLKADLAKEIGYMKLFRNPNPNLEGIRELFGLKPGQGVFESLIHNRSDGTMVVKNLTLDGKNKFDVLLSENKIGLIGNKNWLSKIFTFGTKSGWAEWGVRGGKPADELTLANLNKTIGRIINIDEIKKTNFAELERVGKAPYDEFGRQIDEAAAAGGAGGPKEEVAAGGAVHEQAVEPEPMKVSRPEASAPKAESAAPAEEPAAPVKGESVKAGSEAQQGYEKTVDSTRSEAVSGEQIEPDAKFKSVEKTAATEQVGKSKIETTESKAFVEGGNYSGRAREIIDSIGGRNKEAVIEKFVEDLKSRYGDAPEVRGRINIIQEVLEGKKGRYEKTRVLESILRMLDLSLKK